MGVRAFKSRSDNKCYRQGGQSLVDLFGQIVINIEDFYKVFIAWFTLFATFAGEQ
jgi:hypothetical protein